MKNYKRTSTFQVLLFFNFCTYGVFPQRQCVILPFNKMTEEFQQYIIRPEYNKNHTSKHEIINKTRCRLLLININPSSSCRTVTLGEYIGTDLICLNIFDESYSSVATQVLITCIKQGEISSIVPCDALVTTVFNCVPQLTIINSKQSFTQSCKPRWGASRIYYFV